MNKPVKRIRVYQGNMKRKKNNRDLNARCKKGRREERNSNAVMREKREDRTKKEKKKKKKKIKKSKC
jgi:hypothetical protein